MSTVCPGATTLEGIDVSSFQATVDWAMVKASGKSFAIARIANGVTPDTAFTTNWSGIKAAGLVRGAYQEFQPNGDPIAQANYVIATIGPLQNGDLPIIADVTNTGGQTPATIAANLMTWAAAIEAGTGKPPIIYTSAQFWDGMVQSSAFGSDLLWDANWGVSCPNLPTGWTAFAFWQYSDTGTVAGVSGNVDLDKFNGSDGDLAQLTATPPGPEFPPDDLPPGDPTDIRPDAPRNSNTGHGGGCCDAGGAPDAATAALAAIALAFTGRRRSSKTAADGRRDRT